MEGQAYNFLASVAFWEGTKESAEVAVENFEKARDIQSA